MKTKDCGHADAQKRIWRDKLFHKRGALSKKKTKGVQAVLPSNSWWCWNWKEESGKRCPV